MHANACSSCNKMKVDTFEYDYKHECKNEYEYVYLYTNSEVSALRTSSSCNKMKVVRQV